MKAIKLACLVVAMAGGCAVDETESYDVETTEQAATQADVWHGTWNGGSANAQFWSGYGGGYVDVFENGTGSSRSAWVNLATWSIDPSSQVCWSWTDWWGYTYNWCWYTRSTYTYGWGQVPAGDAQLTPGNARLKTTFGAGFSGYQCVYDWSNWTSEPCTSLAGGSVDATWRKDGSYSVFSSGTHQTSYGTYSFKTQGTYRHSSARASGSILGIDFSDAYGYFGDTRQTNVSKSIFRTPKP